MIIYFDELTLIRRLNRDKKIVFCSGAFDLPHVCHVLFFEACKKYGDILVVEVAHDELIRKNKGPHRPIIPEGARLKTVDSFKPVDYCFLDHPVSGNALDLIGEVLRRLKPHRYVLNRDASDMPYRQELAARSRTELVVLDGRHAFGFQDVSTSGIIAKIRALPE